MTVKRRPRNVKNRQIGTANPLEFPAASTLFDLDTAEIDRQTLAALSTCAICTLSFKSLELHT